MAVCLLWPWCADVANAQLAGYTYKDFGLDPVPVKIENLMNFGRCVKPKVKACALPGRVCPKAPYVSPALQFDYQEPVAVVEVTCVAGKSDIARMQKIEGLMMRLVDEMVGPLAQQRCEEAKAQTDKATYYFEARVWGVSPFAKALAGKSTPWDAAVTFACDPPGSVYRGKDTTAALQALKNQLIVVSHPSNAPQAAIAGVTAHLPWGLIPSLWTEFLRGPTGWSALPSPDGLGDPVAMVGGLPLTLACAAHALGKDVGTLAGLAGIDVAKFESEMAANWSSLAGCVGMWGLESPYTGHVPVGFRPIAMGLAMYRAYKLASASASVLPGGLSSVKANSKGTQMFNLDYPFLHPPSKGDKRGSGCYDVGTALPAWYSRGEMGAEGLASFVDALTPKSVSELFDGNNSRGDFIFTLWKRTSCCVPVLCWEKPYIKQYY
jgi:hypothetical protein